MLAIAAIFEAYLYHKYIWIAETDYYMYFDQMILFPLTDIQKENIK